MWCNVPSSGTRNPIACASAHEFRNILILSRYLSGNTETTTPINHSKSYYVPLSNKLTIRSIRIRGIKLQQLAYGQTRARARIEHTRNFNRAYAIKVDSYYTTGGTGTGNDARRNIMQREITKRAPFITFEILDADIRHSE